MFYLYTFDAELHRVLTQLKAAIAAFRGKTVGTIDASATAIWLILRESFLLRGSFHPELVEIRGWELESIRRLLPKFQKKDPSIGEELFRSFFRRVWAAFLVTKCVGEQKTRKKRSDVGRKRQRPAEAPGDIDVGNANEVENVPDFNA